MGDSPAILIARSRAPTVINRLARRVCSFPIFLAALLAAGVFVGGCLQGIQGDLLFSEGDTWWHVQAGEDILRTHTLPAVDTYSATGRGTEWVAYEWLGEVAMAAAFRAGGLEGLKLLDLGLASVLVILLYGYSTLRSGNSKCGFIVSAACLPVVLGFCTMRPQMLGWAFFLLTLLCIESFQQGNDHAIWFLPLIFLFWVNTHGTFVFGFLVLALVWAGAYFHLDRGAVTSERWTRERRRAFAYATLGCFLMLPLTPYGTRLASYPLELALTQPLNVGSIREWLPLATETSLSVIVLTLLVGFYSSLLFGRTVCRIPEMALVLICALGAAVHLRLVILFVFVSAPLIATGLRRVVPGYSAKKDHPISNAILILLLVVIAARAFPTPRRIEETMAAHYPVRGVEYLGSHHVRSPLFNEYSWGGYLIWTHAFPPGIFIDGRADIYERTGTLADYLSIARLKPEAFRVIDKLNLQTFLIDRGSALATALEASPVWKRAYGDDVSVIYIRRAATPYASDLQRSNN
jgi:hypothetical protein